MPRVIDRGWDRIRKEMRLMNGSFTKVGIQAGTPRRASKEDPKPAPMVTVALANEFGTPDQPERSFMRTTYDERRATVTRLMESEKDKILRGASTTARSLALVGEYFQGQVQKKIRSNVPPPNAPATVRKKKSSTTLIDTAQMLGAVRHVEVLRGARKQRREP